jgi:hypothetical protein
LFFDLEKTGKNVPGKPAKKWAHPKLALFRECQQHDLDTSEVVTKFLNGTMDLFLFRLSF